MYQNFSTRVVRAAAILTNAYVAGTVIDDAERFNQASLYCTFTKGSLTSLDIKIESSIDGTNYVQETNLSVSGSSGDGTLNRGKWNTTEDGSFKISFPYGAKYIKVSTIGNGTVTNSSLGINAFLQQM